MMTMSRLLCSETMMFERRDVAFSIEIMAFVCTITRWRALVLKIYSGGEQPAGVRHGGAKTTESVKVADRTASLHEMGRCDRCAAAQSDSKKTGRKLQMVDCNS
jgi:hypothetical protein